MLAKYQKISTTQEQSFYTEDVRLQRFTVPWHYHPEYELTYIAESHGTRFVGDHMEPFQAGDLALIGTNLPHLWKNSDDVKNARALVVQLLPEKAGSTLFGLPEMKSIQNFLWKANRGLRFTGCTVVSAVRKQMEEIIHAGETDRIVLLLQILSLLASESEAVSLASESYVPQINQKSGERINRVYNFLMSEFTRTIALEEVAQIAAMTPEAFCRYFKKTSGRTLRDFLNQVRIDFASRQLIETEKTVTEICFESGFSTVSNFNKRFRELKQCSPREFRRAHVDLEQ